MVESTDTKTASTVAQSELAQPIKEKISEAKTTTNGNALPSESSTTESEPIVETKYKLVRSVGEECIEESELRNLLTKKGDSFVLYDGFEPSGRMHIAQGVYKSINVNKCTKAGGIFKFWVADWFGLMNDKMGGDLEKIKDTGKYLIKVWQASGMNFDRVQFLWTSDEIEKNAKEYWTKMLDISRNSNLRRIKKCCTIMGRFDESHLHAAQILYPIMQCTDIFFLKADICQLGVDQRKVNMLAREYCAAIGKKNKPIILSHHMLYGLLPGQAKMSKSNPDSAIFMEDTVEDVRRKITNAYCPLKPEEHAVTQESEEMSLVKDELKNPILDYIRHIIFSNPDAEPLVIGTKSFTGPDEVDSAWKNEEISETDMKESLITRLNYILEPVREKFTTDSESKAALDLIEQHKATIKSEKDAGIQKPIPLRRLGTVFKNLPGSPQTVGVVFAPKPKTKSWTKGVIGSMAIETVLETTASIVDALENGADSVLVWMEDWSSYVLGDFSGDKEPMKLIRAFYTQLESCIKLLKPDLFPSDSTETSSKITFRFQSDEILRDPNNYWISVIDAGRKTTMSDCSKGLKPGEILDESGQIVAMLLHCADMLALSTLKGEGKEESSVKNVFIVPTDSEVVIDSAASDSTPHGKAPTSIVAMEYIEKYLKDKVEFPSIKVDKQGCEKIAIAFEARKNASESMTGTEKNLLRMELMVNAGENTWNAPMKKVFCLEKDAIRNDLLIMISRLVSCKVLKEGSDDFFFVQGNEKHGEPDRSYKTLNELTSAVEDGTLHPSSFKPAATKVIKGALTCLAKAPTIKADHTVLENYFKRAAKQK